jgi:cell division transport system permease protein
MAIKDDFRSFRRSWVHHTGMQLATLTVLAATFTVVVFVFSLSMNLQRVLSTWGQGIQMSVYLSEGLDADAIAKLRAEFESMPEVAKATYIPKEVATENFKKQMASYAPDLLSDSDFSNPFPASYRLSLNEGVATGGDVNRLEKLAGRIEKMNGVEDMSYGESWVRNYSAFLSSLNASGGVMALILIAGSMLVIGNSIRASISARREEIEILELVGATPSMIRRPFVTEGFFMGLTASGIAVALNLGVFFWQKSMLTSNLVLARLLPALSFLDIATIISFIGAGALLGAFGAWLTIRRINDGWSASQGLET